MVEIWVAYSKHFGKRGVVIWRNMGMVQVKLQDGQTLHFFDYEIREVK